MTGPDDAPSGNPRADKVQKLADEAVEAGKKFMESDTGRKVAEVAETGFAKAEELLDKARASETGRQAMDAVQEAQASGKQFLSTELGKNVGIGAGAGAVAGIVLPFLGPLLGAVVGGGLGYLRTITKKP